MQEDLLYLNEKFGNLVCSSEILNKDMSALCYWCENRGIMKCKNCERSFCKFCVKNGHLADEIKRVCFVCGCYELTEVVKNDTNCCLRDREMCDMLKRYEELCSNDKLANSIHDLLINIDALGNENFPRLFEVIKLNIFSMLHDIQKVETMVNQAVNDNRQEDIDRILMPLLKVVMKHHVFKRLGRPQHCFGDEMPAIDSSEQMNNRMELSVKQSDETINDDNERIQRSPDRLAEEEKLTSKFEILDSVDDENCRNLSINKQPDNSLSLVSYQLDQLNEISFHLDQPDVVNSPTKERRKRSKRLSEIERRSVRLRSETNPPPSFNALQSDLGKAMATALGDQPSSVSPLPICRVSSIKEEKACENSSSVSSIDSATRQSLPELIGLRKFAPVTGRNKNSHLVSPAPIKYERPFVLKADMDKAEELLDELTQPPPATNKTWSWERTSPLVAQKYLIPAAATGGGAVSRNCRHSNGNLGKILNKTVIIPKSMLDSSIRGRIAPIESAALTPPPLQMVPVKRSSSPSLLTDSDEPKKKRGRPRKYFGFECYTPVPSTSNADSRDTDRRNSSDFSDLK